MEDKNKATLIQYREEEDDYDDIDMDKLSFSKFSRGSSVLTGKGNYVELDINYENNDLSYKDDLSNKDDDLSYKDSNKDDDFTNYKLSTLLGKGAFANVYKGINLKNNNIIAVKKIKLDLNQNVEELMVEINLLKILNHKNIVKYFGYKKTPSYLNIYLEYCLGNSLRTVYKNSPLTEEKIIYYTKSILNGLNYLHSQGVVHRDVKAANVLINHNFEIKLADFGVATKISKNNHFTLVGTPNWMAPESIIGGEGLCTASDIWSLGATIIELFTTHPPYHNLNPMATLYAISTDLHPPLPKNILSIAKDFLLECFQKQPGLRSSAKTLLNHKWLTGEKLIVDRVETLKVSQYSKNQLLNKFFEKDNLNFSFNLKTNTPKLFNYNEDDPFIDINIENFNTSELEIQNKMEFLVNKFISKINLIELNDEILINLIKITGKILNLIKKNPLLNKILIRDHGLISIMELLQRGPELKNNKIINKLWYYTISILNEIFNNNIIEFENFCFLGGIQSIFYFKASSFDLKVRLQVIEFIKKFQNSDKALLMLVSNGGLKIVCKFIEEDFDPNPNFSLISIECIHGILNKDLTRFKSDLCRILSKFGVLFWIIVLLNRLTNKNFIKPKNIKIELINNAILQIFDIIIFFTQSETKVLINISNKELFKLLIKTYYNGKYNQQIILLKFLKSLTNITEILPLLYEAEILEFLIRLMEIHSQGTKNYKEVMNIVCPMLYNCCYLNQRREIELIQLGGISHLKSLAMINLPFRQFILPLVCELVYCDDEIRDIIMDNDILNIYYNLLLDPYWQSNALDSILVWQNYQTNMKLSTRAIDCIVGGFLLSKVSNMESTVDNYLKLCLINKKIIPMMFLVNVVQSILQKLHNHKSSVIQVTLLRLLKLLIKYGKLSNNSTYLNVAESVKKELALLQSNGSVLIQELTQEVVALASC